MDDHVFENSHFSLLSKQVVIVVYHHFFEYFIFLKRNFHFLYEQFVSLVMSPSGIFFHIAFTHCGGGSLDLLLFHSSQELHVFIEFFVSESFTALFSFPQVLIFGEGVCFIWWFRLFTIFKLNFLINDFHDFVFLHFLQIKTFFK
jgi:hypothetical protein